MGGKRKSSEEVTFMKRISILCAMALVFIGLGCGTTPQPMGTPTT